MEKSRAIEVLKPLANSFVDYANITMKEEDDDTAEALEMAIEALKAQLSQEGTTKDAISRQAAIDALIEWYGCEPSDIGAFENIIEKLPSAQPEQLTDAEQRIFLKAIEREEKVCKKVDEEWGSGDEECEINLVHVCHEIIRKVKGALWT